MQHHTFEEGLKYRPDYAWPEDGAERDCPKCQETLEIVENDPSYMVNLGGVRSVNGNFLKKIWIIGVLLLLKKGNLCQSYFWKFLTNRLYDPLS